MLYVVNVFEMKIKMEVRSNFEIRYMFNVTTFLIETFNLEKLRDIFQVQRYEDKETLRAIPVVFEQLGT